MSGDSLSMIVIGNEVLTGKVSEENAQYVIQELRGLGVRLERIVIIRDVVDSIAEEIIRVKKVSDWVITSGGIGPTHDDVTFEGVAKALGIMMQPHPFLVERINARKKPEMTEAELLSMDRLSLLPEGAELIPDPMHRYPLIRVQNIFVLPGVPIFFRSKFQVVKKYLKITDRFSSEVLLAVSEELIAEFLRELQTEFTDVEMGSYPRFETAGYKVKVTFEGCIESRVKDASERFVKGLPRASLYEA